jgi:hypothetical protein
MSENTTATETTAVPEPTDPGTGQTATATVARALTDHRDGVTTRALARATGLAQTTVQDALVAMEAAGTAYRTPGERKGSADQWHATPDGVTADDATPEAIPDGATPEAMPDGTIPDDTTADGATPEATLDDATPDDAAPDDLTPEAIPDATPDDATPEDAPVSGVPVSAPPRRPDLKVMIMAGVLGGHPEGVSAVEAVEESGLASGVGDAVLAAMEAIGAAARGPADENGTELWVLGEADIADVDLATGPSPHQAVCPTCRAPRPIRRFGAPATRRVRTASPISGAGTGAKINTDGSERLRKNELRGQVEAFMRSLGTGVEMTPRAVSVELARSSGAVGNAMSYLTGPGVLVLTREAPVAYALSATAPEPAPEIAELMTRPVLSTPEPQNTGTDNTTTDADTTDADTTDAEVMSAA